MEDFKLIKGLRGLVDNARVYNLENAIRSSKFPMLTDTEAANDDVTKGIDHLAKTDSQSGEDNFLSGIIVVMDLTLSNKMWVEFERYHFAQIVSSQSSMHRMSKFTLPDQYCGYVDDEIVERMMELQAKYNDTKSKEDYLKLLYSNPAGFNLTAQVVTNYRQLKTMYRQRHNHRLPEWRAFCEWMRIMLPNSDWITGCENNG